MVYFEIKKTIFESLERITQLMRLFRVYCSIGGALPSNLWEVGHQTGSMILIPKSDLYHVINKYGSLLFHDAIY
jgi:hypothetical protein